MLAFTGKPWQVTSQMMQYNRQWMLNELRSGRTILDIGRAATRINPSIFYQMEQNMIKNYYFRNDPCSSEFTKSNYDSKYPMVRSKANVGEAIFCFCTRSKRNCTLLPRRNSKSRKHLVKCREKNID